MPSRVQHQLALDEQVITNPDLEAALEKRLRASDDLAEIRTVYKSADETAKGLIAALDLTPESAVRCGRFRITKSDVPAKSVTFETEATTRVRISLLDDD